MCYQLLKFLIIKCEYLNSLPFSFKFQFSFNFRVETPFDSSQKLRQEVTPDNPNISKHDAGGFECPICMDTLKGKDTSTTPCGHIFCTECIRTAMLTKKFCPICKKSVRTTQIHRVFLPGLY